MSGDCTVNWQDLQIFAGQWLDTGGCSEPNCADLDDNNNVDAFDFALLAENWDETGITLVINEFMAKNDSFIQDPCGEYDDWIEIYNYGDMAIDVGGMYLTDNLLSPTKWQVPGDNPSETTIAAGGYLLIWADEETHQGTLHADFKLKASGDEIGLYDVNFNPIDSITFGSQDGDNSYGRFPNGSDTWQVFIHDSNTPPTPGASNGGEPIGQQVLINEIMYHPYHDSIILEPEDILEEYIELFNGSAVDVNLQGWRFTDGVEFTFPNVIIGSGQYLVVATDVNTFTAKYPGVTNVVGGWVGRLSNSGEAIELINAEGVRIDWVRYADEGDWAKRLLGPLDYGHRGWLWSDDHDGNGCSLELVNPALSNECGQNWMASLISSGTPGVQNSADSSDIAPMILDVEHLPVIPQSTDVMTVTACIVDELTTGTTVTLYYRVDESTYNETVYPTHDPNDYNTVAMLDDGMHGDGKADDGVYGTQIPAHANDTIIEFYVAASDSGANSRAWPAPSDVDGSPEQVTNLLYQVDDSFDPDLKWAPGAKPIYYIIMTESERGRLEYIGSHDPERYSDAQMNATFISIDGVDTKVRYNVGVRNRGEGTRRIPPNNYRVNFRHDDPWKGVTAININSKYTYLQLVGSAIFRLAGLPATDATAVQVRVNGENLALTDPTRMYGSYVYLEVYDSDFTDKHFPNDSGGNLYKASHYPWTADLSYLGTDPADYFAAGYYKRTNKAQNDWSDLINLTYVLTNTPDANYVEEVKKVVNVDQWLRWFAIQSLIGNNETNLGNGYGDDYYMYRGVEDPRFVLLPHDLDTILGLGDDPASVDDSIFRAANPSQVPVIERFLKHPSFVGRYCAYLKQLIKTTFSPGQMNPLLEHALGDFVPQSTIDDMKNFIAARNAHVLSQIPQQFTINSDLGISKGYYKTTGATLAELKAVLTANTTEPRSVRVNGQPADWLRISGKWWDAGDEWTIDTNVTLNPGINRVVVQTFDDANGTGSQVERGCIDIWYDVAGSSVPNPLMDVNTVLDAVSGPWYVSSNLTIPADKALTIEPAATVFFSRGKSLTVNGRLVAQGTEYQRIRLTLNPNAGGNPSQHWNGINFANTLQDNQLCYVDMEFPDNDNEAIDISYSRVLIDNMNWIGTNKMILDMYHPSLTLSNSFIPGVADEPIHGTNVDAGEYVIMQGNVFGVGAAGGDIIDWESSNRSFGALFLLLNNVFLGGGDDGVDLDGTDAHVEGNVFMNFHRSNDPDPSRTTTSNAIACGEPYSGDLNRTEVIIVRNIFFDNDHALLLKEEASATIINNTFVDSNEAVIQFWEEQGTAVDGPSLGAYIAGNIFWNYGTLFKDQFSPDPNQWPDPNIIVNRSVIPADMHYLGEGNLDVDPLFIDPDANDFRLQFISPAIGAGINGMDMGAHVPAGASVSGEPNSLTYHTDANLTVDGPSITHYKYRINDGPWSGEISVDVPIELMSLVDGNSYTVYVKGKNIDGIWQSDPNFNVSNTWTIDTSYSQLVINEALAQNIEAVDHNGTSPDLIELFYNGPSSLNLFDMSISDNPDSPRKFVFPPGTTINPGEYLVLYADDNILTPGLHMGFGLNADGEGVYLFDTKATGSTLLDSVEFGIQLGDLSIGRVAHGQWRLTIPTFGQANIAHILGNPASLKVNEWFTEGDVFRNTDFIEIYNPHTMPVDMGGMFLTDEPVAEPNRHQIAPLSFVPAAGYGIFIADGDPEDGPRHLNFRLSSDQEIIGLFDTGLNKVDQVIYYPQTTDISEGRSPDGNDAYEFIDPPTTGVSNITAVVVNEVMAHSHGVAPDWIELYNTTDANIDISGWYLSDNSGNRTKYRIADGTTIDANDYIVFYEDIDFNDPCDPNCLAPFALSENGEMVCLSSALDGVLTGYFKKQDFGASQTGISFGRYLKSTGIYDFVAMGSNTPGSANAYPKVGPIIINEIMYHPEPNGDAEYIELYNITGTDVNLYDEESNPWKFTDGIEFTFPVDANISAYDYLLVVRDINAFEAEYTSVPDVQIFEWDSGRLDNAGEKVEISMPGDVDAAGERQYICIDSVRYDDSTPWPIEPDGYGYSLERNDPNLYGNDPNSWQATLPSPGQ